MSERSNHAGGGAENVNNNDSPVLHIVQVHELGTDTNINASHGPLDQIKGNLATSAFRSLFLTEIEILVPGLHCQSLHNLVRCQHSASAILCLKLLCQ